MSTALSSKVLAKEKDYYPLFLIYISSFLSILLTVTYSSTEVYRHVEPALFRFHGFIVRANEFLYCNLRKGPKIFGLRQRFVRQFLLVNKQRIFSIGCHHCPHNVLNRGGRQLQLLTQRYHLQPTHLCFQPASIGKTIYCRCFTRERIFLILSYQNRVLRGRKYGLHRT